MLNKTLLIDLSVTMNVHYWFSQSSNNYKYLKQQYGDYFDQKLFKKRVYPKANQLTVYFQTSRKRRTRKPAIPPATTDHTHRYYKKKKINVLKINMFFPVNTRVLFAMFQVQFKAKHPWLLSKKKSDVAVIYVWASCYYHAVSSPFLYACIIQGPLINIALAAICSLRERFSDTGGSIIVFVLFFGFAGVWEVITEWKQ